MESKKAQDVFEHHRKLTELLEAFERRAYDDWLANVDEQCSFNLNQPLLSRDDETKLLKLNFDDQVCFRAVLASRLSFTICHGITGIISRHLQLVAVLREVRYFEERGREDIPDSAAAIYAKNDTLRDYVNNLNLTVQWYNKVRKETLEVEFPLIEQQVSAIDEQLKQALDSLTWNSETAWDYIQQTRDMVSLHFCPYSSR